MAQLRDLKRRIKSVRNTIKITRTMELVATARAKQNQDRLHGAQPYFETLASIAREVGRHASGGEGDDGAPAHPLLEQRDRVERVALLLVTADRGFCGGYNSNVIGLAVRRAEEERAAGREVDLYVSGRKGVSALRFRHVETAGKWLTIGDRPSFESVVEIADHLAREFREGNVDRVEVAYWHYYTAGRQRPEIEQVLPFRGDDEAGDAEGGEGEAEKKPSAPSVPPTGDLIIEPDADQIISSVIPLRYRTNIFRIFLEAAASEQLARRAAMKAATDNGSEMAKILTGKYNRARQAQITTEILEIMGGAEALKG